MASELEMQEAEDYIDRLHEQVAALKAELETVKRERDTWRERASINIEQHKAEAKLAGGEVVKVKSLEWRDTREEWGSETYEASAAFGSYSVFSDEDSAAGAIFVEFAVKPEHFGMAHAIPIDRVHDWDEAKAVAQADYERRIMAALREGAS